jgi:hypothetical protein
MASPTGGPAALNLQDIALAVVGVATITALFNNPYTANIVKAIGDQFRNAILAALGK